MFTGNPATLRGSVFLYENRATSHRDMPLDVFIQRFQVANESNGSG